MTISGEDDEIFLKPNVEKIVEKSKPSPIGKGDTTLWRNVMEKGCSGSSSKFIFPYNLAVYENTERFEYHRYRRHWYEPYDHPPRSRLNPQWKSRGLGIGHEGLPGTWEW